MRRAIRNSNLEKDISLVIGKQAWKVVPDERSGPDNPCLWMKAGVVKFKDCKNEFDCITCRYDKAMGKKNSWQDAMRMRGGMDRTCRHSLTGQYKARRCAINYECGKCDFDQFFEDVMIGR